MPKGRNFLYLIFGIFGGVVLTLIAVSALNKPAKPVAVEKIEITQVLEEPSVVEAKKKVEAVAPAETKAVISTVTTEVKAEIPQKAFKPEFQKGMTYIAWTQDGYSNPSAVKAIEQLSALGVNWVAVIPTWYQEKTDSTQISKIMDKTPSDESLITAIRQLHEKGFKLMLKPHLDLTKSEGKWRADIGFLEETDWQVWFNNYTGFILHYAEIAAAENIELFCIGTELSTATVEKPELWRGLIKQVKEIYKGELTYAANWYNEYDKIEFWNELDYAGVDPYFPLVCSIKPSVEDLKGPWNDWMKNIEAWQKRINKPVIFSEIGYKSAVGSTDEPWQHTSVGDLDLELQSNCYQAILENFWDKPWFYGAYWWYWGVHPKMGGVSDKGFTPQNKPAQEIIKEWYNKPVSAKTY